jgi:tRNA pseudouridine38-40 synthase
MRTLLLTLAYEGTRYVGWQRQAEGVSIQGLLEEALAPLEGARVVVTGAGRTDAGVHATGQRASFDLTHPIAPPALVRALNARLPHDVRVLAAEERPAGFNARFAALGKRYRYVIQGGPVADPFDARWSWHVPAPLDVGAMAAALAHLRGTHDFAAFRAAGSDVVSTQRTLWEAQCRLEDPSGPVGHPRALPAAPRVAIDLRGDGFLRHMVRTIAGTLVEVGLGRRRAGDMPAVLASLDRGQAGPTAPARGLFLLEVDYPPAGAPVGDAPAPPREG